MEQQRRIFISYSRTNGDFALKLAKELNSEGFAAWVDQLDIPAGARWDDEVERALRECEIFMLILTPASVASNHVKDEIGYALGKNKRFIPVMLENCDVPFRLQRFQYVDFTKKSFDEGFQAIKELLRSLFAQTTSPRETLPASAQDQNAQASTEPFATLSVEDEFTAQTKAETERKEKEETARLVAQKDEAEKLAKQKAADELDAQARDDTERKAKGDADRVPELKAEVDKQEIRSTIVDPGTDTTGGPKLKQNWLETGWKRGLIAFIIGGTIAILSFVVGSTTVETPWVPILIIISVVWGLFGFLCYPHRISYILSAVLGIIFSLIFFVIYFFIELSNLRTFYSRQGLLDLPFFAEMLVGDAARHVVGASFLHGFTGGFILAVIISRFLHSRKKI